MTHSTPRNAHPIVGARRLLSFEVQRDDGTVTQPFGPDVRGVIIFTASGRFSAHVMRAGRAPFAADDQVSGTSEEIEASFKSCISYFGAYTLDLERKCAVHHVEGSLFPNWEGGDQQRFFEVSGDHPKLSTPPIGLGGGGQVVGTFLWERV